MLILYTVFTPAPRLYPVSCFLNISMPTSLGFWGSLTSLPFQLPSQAGLSPLLLLAHSLTEYFITAPIFWLVSNIRLTYCAAISDLLH